jgi:hypothetical protein
MKKLAWILMIMTLPALAQAQDAIYLSGMLGLTRVGSDNANLETDPELSYGARAGLLFNDHIAAGLFLHRTTYDVSGSNFLGPFTTEPTFDNVMAEVTYYFAEADENSFWISGLLGMTFNEIVSNGFSRSEDATSYGLSAGYHFMVAPNWSISPQFTYIQSNFDDSVNEISALANLTVWL